jgi:hypothetical protein
MYKYPKTPKSLFHKIIRPSLRLEKLEEVHLGIEQVLIDSFKSAPAWLWVWVIGYISVFGSLYLL